MKNKTQISWSVISEINELKDIKDSWNLLNLLSNNGCFCTSPEWLLNWIDIFWQPEWRLHVLVGSSNNETIALAPFFIQTKSGCSYLRFIGTGEPEQEEITSEYIDILFLEKYQYQVVDFLSHHIKSIKNRIQQLEFNRVLETSLIVKVVDLLANKFYINKNPSGLRYIVNLKTSNWAEYLSKINSKSFKKKLKVCLRRFSETKSSNHEVLYDSKDIKKMYPKLVKLHQTSWNNNNKEGAFSTKKFNQFHQNFLTKASKENNVLFLTIVIGDTIVAVFYYIIYKKHCYYYQSGINKDFRPNLSPGILGHALMIQYCQKHKIQSYDFMMGNQSDSYKSKFNPNTEQMYDILLVKKDFSGFFYLLRWSLKKLKHYLQL